MKQLSKVVWSEGMHLGPHHFQVQNRYFEEITHFGISKLWFEPYGIVGLELDAEALRNGTVSVVHARGIFPDGLTFNMPESDPLPAPRGIADSFPPTRESLTVLMAIPPVRLGAPNIALPEQEQNGSTRFIAESTMLPDENTGADEKSVQVGRKNIRILLDTEEVGQRVMASPNAPSVTVGPQCTSPYECPFLSRCTEGKQTPEYPIQLLPRGGKALEALIADGYHDLREVPAERLTSEIHRRVHQATMTGAPYFDATVAAELQQLPLPYSYLDFETISFSVLEVIGTRPYEKVPFQWSVHVETGPTNIRHAEYLAIESFGDFDAMASSLIAIIPPEGPIFAYNASFEAAVLNGLADRLPNKDGALRGLAGRLVDLLPIAREAYYHPDMQGSWSIKNVMPTILPGIGL